MNPKTNHGKDGKGLIFIKCLLLSLATAAGVLCLLCAAVLSLPDPEPLCPVAALLVTASLCFFGSRITVRKTGGKGSGTGLLFGLCTVLLCALTALGLSLPLSPAVFAGTALGMLFLSFLGGRGGEKKKASPKRRGRRRTA